MQLQVGSSLPACRGDREPPYYRGLTFSMCCCLYALDEAANEWTDPDRQPSNGATTGCAFHHECIVRGP